jgi:uncharacterized surface protein with fasciclin (FAS1) repeats
MVRNMFKMTFIAVLASSGLVASVGFAEKTVMVGGEAMYPSKNIIQNASNSKDHTTLVAAVKAAGLVETLEGKGPFTVFAPTNEAFGKLPKDTVPNLLKPESKDDLAKILTYHVVAGKISAADLMAKIAAGGGEFKAKTVQGEELTFKMEGEHVVIIGGKADNKAEVTIADVFQSNGVIHVIDTVLLP